MKVFTIAAIILLIISLPVFSRGQSEDSPKMEGVMIESSIAMEEESELPFIEYKDIEHAMMLAESKPTVLFFNASWCPSCKSARENFEANSADFVNINLVLVDYDHSADLQKKYGVTYQHTFVQIASDGEAIVKWNGGGTKELVAKTMMKEM